MSDDKPAVSEARLAQLNTIKEWFSMDYLPDHDPDFASKENQKRNCDTTVEMYFNMHPEERSEKNEAVVLAKCLGTVD